MSKQKQKNRIPKETIGLSQSTDDVSVSLDDVELSDEAIRQIEQLTTQLNDAIAARQRALADYVNYQRRAAENERKADQSGAIRVIRSLLPVLDHFAMALQQDTSQATVDQIIGGMKLVHDELVRSLQSVGVDPISPNAGEPFDPNKHEAMMQQPSEDVSPNCIVQVLKSGYQLGQLVLRPAQVIIALSQDTEG